MGWLYAELRAEHLGESSYSLSVAASLGLVSCHNGESTSGKPGMNEGGAPTKFPRPQPRGKIAGRPLHCQPACTLNFPRLLRKSLPMVNSISTLHFPFLGSPHYNPTILVVCLPRQVHRY